MTEQATRYDSVPYPDFVHPRTNPNSVAAIVRLFGVDAADPSRATILELGCGQGANLISLASIFPHTRCVGIDLSGNQIAAGRACIEHLGLSNIQLHAADLSDFPACLPTPGGPPKFDFIIVHGVYSWVPDPVRLHLLRIAREHLSEVGIALVSYNTYPGWHAKAMVREMLRYHCGAGPYTLESIAEAKRFLAEVAQSVPDTTGYGRTLREQSLSISKSNDAYLFHEQFEDINQPRYFHQFLNEIEASGLDYVCESSLTYLPSLSDEMRQRLPEMPMRAREQYTDYLCNRSFRQSLICRHDTTQPPGEFPDAAALENLHLSTDASCSPPSADGSVPQFTDSKGTSVTLSNPISRAAMLRLVEIQPASESFQSLCKHVQQSLGDQFDSQSGLASLQADLLQLAHVAMITLHATSLPLVNRVSERPKASSLARWQAQTGESVTSQLHRSNQLGAPERHLIGLCDGKNDMTAIHNGMIHFVTRDGMTLRHAGRPVTDPLQLAELVREKLGPNLNQLARLGYFLA